MATVQNSLQLYEGATAVLRRINRSVRMTAESFQNLQIASGNAVSLSGLQAARTDLRRLGVQFEQVEEVIGRTHERQGQLNQTIEEGKKKTEKLKAAFGKVASGLGKLGIATSMEDIFAQANSVKAAGNTLQAKTGMQGQDLDMAKQSAKNLYVDNMSGSLEDAANSLATVNQMTGQTGASLEGLTRAGLLVGDTFGYSLTDSIGAAQTLEKQFGASGAESFDLIIQATQAGLDKNGELLDTINQFSGDFSSLGLGGQDMFNMLINGAQNGDVSMTTLGNAVKEFSSNAVSGGKDAQDAFSSLGLDANEMTQAFGSGGEEAKQAFQKTIDALSGMEDPVQRNIAGTKLFGSAWGELGSDGVAALSNLNGSVELSTDHLEELNNVKYNDASSALSSLVKTINMGLAGPMTGFVDIVTGKLNDFTAGLQGSAGKVNGIFGAIGTVIGTIGNAVETIGNAISDNWSIVEPILWGIIAALLVYNATSILKTVCDTAQAAATLALAAAQNAYNAAMAASPLTWIIIMIIMLIALFYAGVAAVNHFAGTSVSATGLICGAFAVVGAFIGNVLMAIMEVGIGIIEFFYNKLIAFANFFGNLFNDPVGAVIHLFADLADGVLGIMQKIAKGMDLIFGTHMEDTVSRWRKGLKDVADDLASKYGNGSYEVKADTLDIDEWRANNGLDSNRFNYTEKAKKGYDIGDRVEDGTGDKLGGLLDSFMGDSKALDPEQNQTNLNLGVDTAQNTADTAANTAAMADSTDTMDEELKYMRDVAEQEIINRFTLAELKLDINNNNTINSDLDINDITSKMGEDTSEYFAIAAEGANF